MKFYKSFFLESRVQIESRVRRAHLSTMNTSLWKDCEEIYPPADEIARAFQDEGSAMTIRGKTRDVKQEGPPKKNHRIINSPNTHSI
jgi:hypothetical protein